MWFGQPPGLVIFIMFISVIGITLCYFLVKGIREDYEEHKAIDELLGEHTPF